jgi:pilus assembly protein Flp/PilA
MTKLFVTLLSYMSTVAERARNEDEGATAVEYGLMIALIAAGIIGVVGLLRDQLQTVFESVTGALASIP